MTPDPDRPEALLNEVLARPEFEARVETSEPGFFDRLFGRLVEAWPGTPDWVDHGLAVVFVILAVVVLVVLLRDFGRHRRAEFAAEGVAEGASSRVRRPARDDFRAGREALAAGDFAAAVSFLFRAVLARLTERGLLLDDESRTNFEHLRDLRDAREAQWFAQAIPPFERVHYGAREATREDAEAALAAAAPLFPDAGATP